MKINDLLRIITLARQIFRQLNPGGLPDPGNRSAVYQWLRTAFEIGAKLAQWTPTPVDDSVVRFVLTNILATEEQFAAYYEFFKTVIDLLRRGVPVGSAIELGVTLQAPEPKPETLEKEVKDYITWIALFTDPQLVPEKEPW